MLTTDYPGDINKEDCLLPDNFNKNNNNNDSNYYSSERGQFIVNALTGYTYSVRVGTTDEKLFWRVSIPIITKDGITNTLKLFYESPDEYEQHRDIELPYSIKTNWRKSVKKIEIINNQKNYTTVK